MEVMQAVPACDQVMRGSPGIAGCGGGGGSFDGGCCWWCGGPWSIAGRMWASRTKNAGMEWAGQRIKPGPWERGLALVERWGGEESGRRRGSSFSPTAWPEGRPAYEVDQERYEPLL